MSAITESFNLSLDEFVASMKQYRTTLRQLSPGAFLGSNTVVSLPGCRMMKQAISQSVMITARPSADIGLCFPLTPHGFFWNGRHIAPEEQLAIVTSELEKEDAVILLPPRIRQILVSLSDELLRRVLSGREYELFRGHLLLMYRDGKRYRNKQELTSRLEQLFDAIVDLNREGSPVGTQADHAAELVHLLSGYFCSELHAGGRDHSNHERIVDRALKAIAASRGELDLEELAGRVFTSQRNLNYAFKAIIDVPPKRFIHLVRLNEFRAALLAEAAEGRELPMLLSRFGYSNQSRTTREYIELFGEHPRETLEKNTTRSSEGNDGPEKDDFSFAG